MDLEYVNYWRGIICIGMWDPLEYIKSDPTWVKSDLYGCLFVHFFVVLFNACKMVLGRADGTRYINENCPHSFAFLFF